MGKLCMLSYHKGHTYGNWKSIWIGGDFKVIICGASHKGLRPSFIGETDTSRHQIIFIWQLEEGYVP